MLMFQYGNNIIYFAKYIKNTRLLYLKTFFLFQMQNYLYKDVYLVVTGYIYYMCEYK